MGINSPLGEWRVRDFCFHSIRIPSEWGSEGENYRALVERWACFHSIRIPSEWGSPSLREWAGLHLEDCFHSIRIPSEWGFGGIGALIYQG